MKLVIDSSKVILCVISGLRLFLLGTQLDAQNVGAISRSGPSAGSSAVADHPMPGIPADTDQAGNDFQLGVGDVIHVSVWRETELTQTAVVRPDGKISLPLVGEVTVAGKSAIEAQVLVRERLLRFVTDPKVTISVVEIHSRQVYITGQVQRPGAYPLVGSVNVLQLIASAGGLTQYAHKKGIVILHAKNQPRDKFDYNSAIEGKDKREGMLLSPGDTVVVP